jgi:hypothetical protein
MWVAVTRRDAVPTGGVRGAAPVSCAAAMGATAAIAARGVLGTSPNLATGSVGPATMVGVFPGPGRARLPGARARRHRFLFGRWNRRLGRRNERSGSVGVRGTGRLPGGVRHLRRRATTRSRDCWKRRSGYRCSARPSRWGEERDAARQAVIAWRTRPALERDSPHQGNEPHQGCDQQAPAGAESRDVASVDDVSIEPRTDVYGTRGVAWHGRGVRADPVRTPLRTSYRPRTSCRAGCAAPCTDRPRPARSRCSSCAPARRAGRRPRRGRAPE